MQREVLTYRLPDVASAECFRKMYDIIDDSTLAEVKYCPNMHIYSLAKSFLRAAFTSCVVLENYEYVNTDYKPANILLSGIRTDRVIAKVVVGWGGGGGGVRAREKKNYIRKRKFFNKTLFFLYFSLVGKF
ncbi:unnamed protein product, partial [Penicillium nalgiovense]